MSETNTENRATGKVFTQEEVDNIVASRVAREAEKIKQLTVAVEKYKANTEEFETLAKNSAKALEDLKGKLDNIEKEKVLYSIANDSGIDVKLIESFKWDTEQELRDIVETWKPVISSGVDFPPGKHYKEGEDKLRIANSIISKYRK